MSCRMIIENIQICCILVISHRMLDDSRNCQGKHIPNNREIMPTKFDFLWYYNIRKFKKYSCYSKHSHMVPIYLLLYYIRVE